MTINPKKYVFVFLTLMLPLACSNPSRPNIAPTANFTITPGTGTIDTVFVFNASGSSDPEDKLENLFFRWDWDSDGTWDTNWTHQKIVTHQFSTAGSYSVVLEVMDTANLTDLASRQVGVNNSPPVAIFTVSPSSGTLATNFEFSADDSYDLEDNSTELEVRWDWENDGIWDQGWTTLKTADHQYTSTGFLEIVMEIRDSEGLTDSMTKGLSVSPGALWDLYIGSGHYPYSSPALSPDGTIYLGNEYEGLLAITPDGVLKWNYLTTVTYSAPAVSSDGTVIVGCWNRKIIAVNPDGTLKWEYITENEVLSSPAIGPDGVIYCGCEDTYVYALNPDGTLKWKYQTGDRVFSSPAVGADTTIYVGSLDHYLYALRPDGTLKWRFQTNGGVWSSPAIGSDGTLYVGTLANRFYAVNSDGTLKWWYPTGGVLASPAIAEDGTIYISTNDNYLYAITPTGSLLWKYNLYSQGPHSPLVGADGTIYIGSQTHLRALNPDGTIRWEYKHGNAEPVMVCPALAENGHMYALTFNNWLFALETDSFGLANSPWPKFRANSQNTGRKK